MNFPGLKLILIGIMTLCSGITLSGVTVAQTNEWTGANADFIVEDVRVRGLNRISIGTFFGQLPVKGGDRLDSSVVSNIIRTTFNSGLFDDIQVYREGNTLVIKVVERPVIQEIDISGNTAVTSEALIDAMANVGLAKGELLKQATIVDIKNELLRQYVTQGRYGASVDVLLLPRGRNRVSLGIEIDEGEVSSIRRINFIGNTAFSDSTLLDEFELDMRSALWWLSGGHKYSREKLIGDMERLRTFYLNNGYLQFNIVDVNVSLSEDRSSVFITLVVDEGKQFTVTKVETSGKFPLQPAELKRLLLVKENEVYLQRKVNDTEKLLQRALQAKGYAFSQVKAIPQVEQGEESSNKVKIVFYITHSERRGYVRRIEFRGNKKTKDSVLREEILQQEGSVMSTTLVDRSKLRLERSGFYSQVESEIIPVPGVNDQVDVIYKVQEAFSGSLNFSLSYSSVSTFASIGIQQTNFLGTGINFDFAYTASNYQNEFRLAVSEPFISQYGLSRSYRLSQRSSKYDTSTFSAGFLSDTFSFDLFYGLRLNDTSTISAGLGSEQTSITQGSSNFYYHTDFSNSAGQGLFTLVKLLGSWSHNTQNRAIFPNRGSRLSANVEVGLGESLDYYQFSAIYRSFRPINQNYNFGFHMRLHWLDTFSPERLTPFFKHQYVGGLSTIRGYNHATLGPWSYGPSCAQIGSEEESISNGAIFLPAGYISNSSFATYFDVNDPQDPILSGSCNVSPQGAPIVLSGTLELDFTKLFIDDDTRLRSTLFLDFGNGYAHGCDPAYYWVARCNSISSLKLDSELFDNFNFKYSLGLSVVWLTPFGPLNFLFTQAIGEDPWDHTEDFIFTQGTVQ